MPNILKPAALAVLLSMPAGNALAASVTFDLTFLQEPSGDVVGTGFMSFDDPGDGEGLLLSLTNVSAEFVFGGTAWGWGDLRDLRERDNDKYRIETLDGVRSLTLLADLRVFEDGSTVPLVELSMGTAMFTYLETRTSGETSFDGSYLATAVADTGPSVIPLPATLPLLAAGLGALALLRRRVGAG